MISSSLSKLPVEEEHYNFQAAITWSLEQGSIEFQLRMVGALRLYGSRRGYADARWWLEDALAAGANVPPATCARALQAAGQVVQFKNPVRGIELREEALALWRELGNRREIVGTLNNLGEMEWERSNYQRTRRLLMEGLELARDLEEQDRFLVAAVLHVLGRVALQEGSYNEAKERLTESLSISRDAEFQEGIGSALHGLAQVALRQGDVGAGRSLAGEGLVVFQRLGYRSYVASCLETLAEVKAAMGGLVEAARLWGHVAAVRAEALSVIPRCEQPEHERRFAAARSRLGSALCEKAWAEGQGMTLHQAISYALSTDAPAAGEPHDLAELSDRECQVAALIVQRLSNRQIAADLGIPEGTAGIHVHNILKKLGLTSRQGIACWAVENGLVPPSGRQEGGAVLTPSTS